MPDPVGGSGLITPKLKGNNQVVLKIKLIIQELIICERPPRNCTIMQKVN